VGLRGAPFFALTVLLLVASFALVVAFWPRLAGTGPLGVLRRGGALLGVCASVMLVSATVLNDEYAFYADWTDLRTALAGDPPAGQVQERGGASSGRPTGSPDGQAGDRGPAQPIVPSARRSFFTVTGARSGISAQVLVVVPPSYTDPGSAGRRYPVVEALHGLPGGPQAWLTPGLDIVPALDGESGAQRVSDVVLVAPTIDVPKGRDTECVNGAPTDPAVETWLSQDVPDWLAQHFRVATGPSSWSTIGISVGAYCAAEIAMLHPDRFGGAIVLGGYFRPAFTGWRPFPPTDPRLRRYDLVDLARTSPPPVAMWVETSPADPVSFPSSSAFLAAVHAPTAVRADVLAHAGHRASVWQMLEPAALDWLASVLPGFAPRSGSGQP
jgi:pimeloyl-ACP methyl ester carboxylesterase